MNKKKNAIQKPSQQDVDLTRVETARKIVMQNLKACSTLHECKIYETGDLSRSEKNVKEKI